ncbi:uncharacterized protein [Musca autumnalis]|uniref:uncharacterized protein n=1 Tax=Musca autumnalis TaxID=221902 RepID=UPI003CF05696
MVFDFNKLGLWQLVVHLLCPVALINAMIPGVDQKTWTFEIKSLETYSADENILQFDLSVRRVSRGVYAISGSITLKVDFEEDHPCYIEAVASRSSNGVSDFREIPLKMPREHLLIAINSFYKDMLMETLRECSNLPVFADKFEPPLLKGVYTLEKCQFTHDGFPNHMVEGFYKIVIFGEGYVDWSITLVSQVEVSI